MKTSTLAALAVVVALAAGGAAGYLVARRSAAPDRPAAAVPAPLYHCPMHPTVVSDRPGKCPICQMQLVLSVSGPAEDSASARTDVGGLVEVALDARGRALIGVRTAPIESAPFETTVRASAQVAFDETAMHHVHTKVQGWIEHLSAGAPGDSVRVGDPLLTIYSPELLASQQEYLVALDHRDRVDGSPDPAVIEAAGRLLEATRRRLLLQDVTPAQIVDLETTREAPRTVTLHSPVAGTITARNVSHGERIESETSLLDIADLSTVWVIADVYEPDLPFVAPGQEAVVKLAYLPGREWRGRVALVSPLVDPTTRTVKVRVVLDNRGLDLKPGMFAQAELRLDLGARLSVPKDAVLRSGTRDVVFVERGEGHFAPREVRLGLELADRYEVVDGLAAGDRVVSSAAFFVDAESKLSAALAAASEHGAHP